MYEYYFTFKSMTQAQTALSVLTGHGLYAILQRTPKKLSNAGCGYALRLSVDDGFAAAAAFRREGVSFVRCFRLYSNGQMEEVHF